MVPIRTAISETWEEQSNWPMALLCGLLAGLGAIIANIVLPHVVGSPIEHAIIGGLFAGGAVLIGVTAFSVYKHRQSRDRPAT
jgi:hypothetical protein